MSRRLDEIERHEQRWQEEDSRRIQTQMKTQAWLSHEEAIYLIRIARAAEKMRDKIEQYRERGDGGERCLALCSHDPCIVDEFDAAIKGE